MKKLLSLLLAFMLIFPLVVPVSAEETDTDATQDLHGFTLVREEEIPDISSTAMIYEHEKTGAELIWLKNEDPFKVFAATFRTEPGNDTGSPHIIEHALLGGSRKYRSNDLFTDMDAISTNAFMNAFTYADKTVFPIASRDPKDFANLTDIYLDSVFFPNIKEDKSVMDQEGWHYDIKDKDEPITYNGVVYNEMRGADSDPIRLLYQQILSALYPDTIYANNSGGDPEKIPELSYEDFLSFYNSYYNPSNTVLYFYGDVDIDYFLKHIDEEYLSQFERQDVAVKYEKQEPFSEAVDVESVYNIGADEDPSGKTFLSWNVNCGDGGNAYDYYMLQIISDVLADANYAPIKNALFDKGIGEDNGSFYLAYNMNSFGVVAINAEADQKDEFVSTIKECLQKAADEGIGEDALESSINKIELMVREASSNNGLKGMDYLDLILDSKNYGGDPLAYLQFTDIFSELRAGVKEGKYEQFIRERLLDNPHQATIVLKPEPGLSDKKAEEVEAKLADYKASLSEEELQALIDENLANEAKKGAQTENTLPRLNLDEIDTNINEINYDVHDFDGTPVLYSVQPSNGILYLNMQFDLSTVDVDKVPYAALLANLLGSLDTESYGYGDLEKEIYKCSGGIFCETSNAEHTKTHQLDARFVVSSKATAENFPRMLELMNEILFKTKFEDQERIGQQITQMKSGMEMQAQSNGINLALTRIRSYFSPMFKYRDRLSGVDQLRFLQDLEKRYAEDPDSVLEELRAVAGQIFNRKGLVVGVAADEADYTAFEEAFSGYLNELPNEDLENGKFDIEAEKLNEAFATNANINYVVAGGDLKTVLDQVDGSTRLLTNILDNNYLYTELRQKGGAYGAYSLVDNYGNLLFYTYRDPKIVESLDVFRGAGKFLSEYEVSQEDLDQQIIGYFKAYPTTPEAIASLICYREINGQTNEDFLKEAEAVVSMTPEKIRAFGAAIDKIMDENSICVFGNSKQVKALEEGVFDAIVPIVPGQKDAPEMRFESYVVQEGDNLESILLGHYSEDQLTQELVNAFFDANMANIAEDGSIEPGTELQLPLVEGGEEGTEDEEAPMGETEEEAAEESQEESAEESSEASGEESPESEESAEEESSEEKAA